MATRRSITGIDVRPNPARSREGVTSTQVDESRLPNEVLQLAVDSGCSAYDCEFVALAEWLDAHLVTFDRAVLRAFPERAMAPASFTAGR